MKITIVGAAGRTGRELVRLGLQRGHEITAVARRPEGVGPPHDHLTVKRGDVLAPQSLASVIAGADAVVSATGSASGRAPTTLYSAGTANLLSALDGGQRLVVLSALPIAPAAQASALERWVVRPVLYRFFGGAYADMGRMEQRLHASDARWTVVRPPRLLDRPAIGRYRLAIGEPLPGARSITREDLAAAVLDLLDEPTAVRAAVAVAN